jgi:hypothetical protein
MCALLVIVSGAEARAAEVPEGARFYISKTGQAWFKDHFERVLLANGVDLSRRRIEKTEFTLKTLTGASPAHKNQPAPVERLAANFAVWFKGLPFRAPPEFRFSMLDYRYELKFNHLAVEIDPRGAKPYGFKRGVVALLRGDASQFTFEVPRLRAVLNESPDFLGTLGLNGGKASLTGGGPHPARMEIPVLIDVDTSGLAVKVLAVRTNFAQVAVEASFEALLLPAMKIVIDGRGYPFDGSAFEHDVRRLLPEILPLLQEGVKRWFEEQSGREIFQPLMDEVGKLGTVELAIPLGTGARPERVDMVITPTQMRNDDKNIGLAFRASMTDPLAALAGPFLTRGAAGAPALGTAPAAGYDLALALHPAVLNGVLNRMFAHKLLSQVDGGGGELADLDAAPWLLLNQRDPRTVLLHLELSVDAHQWLVESKIPLELDLRLRIAANRHNEVELIAEEIPLDTVVVNTRRTRTSSGSSKAGSSAA